jgi:hypothetical protein
MRVAYFLLLLVVTFSANGIGFASAEDAALANDAAPASIPECIHDAIEVRRLRRSPKVSKGQSEERAGVNAAAAMNLLNSGRTSEQVTSAVVSASRPLTKGEKALVAVISLGVTAGGAVGVYALFKKMLALDSQGA